MPLTRKDRIRLLLGSYDEVKDYFPRHEGRPAGKPGYRHLVRTGLFSEGSYRALEMCLDRLTEREYTSVRWHLEEMYRRGNPKGNARRRKADMGMSMLSRWMPTNIYVPQEVTENSGVVGEKTGRPRRSGREYETA